MISTNDLGKILRRHDKRNDKKQARESKRFVSGLFD